MNILVIGGSGMVGQRVVREAVSRGHAVTALSRHPENASFPEGIKTVQADANNAEALRSFTVGQDAVVLTTSPRDGGDAIQEAQDTVQAVLDALTPDQRLLVVGGAGALNVGGTLLKDTPDFPDAYKAEASAMYGVLRTLQGSQADWTFLSPAAEFAPGERSGHYRVGGDELMQDETGRSFITVEDFAAALLDELETPRYRGQQMSVAY